MDAPLLLAQIGLFRAPPVALAVRRKTSIRRMNLLKIQKPRQIAQASFNRV